MFADVAIKTLFCLTFRYWNSDWVSLEKYLVGVGLFWGQSILMVYDGLGYEVKSTDSNGVKKKCIVKDKENRVVKINKM